LRGIPELKAHVVAVIRAIANSTAAINALDNPSGIVDQVKAVGAEVMASASAINSGVDVAGKTLKLLLVRRRIRVRFRDASTPSNDYKWVELTMLSLSIYLST
jgi:hypothetical protein